MLVTGYASIFHLWTGRSLREFPQFLVAAGVGFILGHWVSQTLQWETFRVGQLSLLEATLASVLALFLVRDTHSLAAGDTAPSGRTICRLNRTSSTRPIAKEIVVVSATVRDIAIILVAVEILVMNGLLVVLIWQVWRLVKMIKVEMKPVIKDSQETVGTVKGSAEFVSTSFISP